MDSSDLAKFLQKGFYVTLGATATLLEVIQDPRKHEENLNSLRRDLDGFTQELADKGVATEAEARSFVDSLIAGQIKTPGAPSTNEAKPSEPKVNTVNTTATPVADANVQEELQELTQELADLRAELERLRQQDN